MQKDVPITTQTDLADHQRQQGNPSLVSQQNHAEASKIQSCTPCFEVPIRAFSFPPRWHGAPGLDPTRLLCTRRCCRFGLIGRLEPTAKCLTRRLASRRRGASLRRSFAGRSTDRPGTGPPPDPHGHTHDASTRSRGPSSAVAVRAPATGKLWPGPSRAQVAKRQRPPRSQWEAEETRAAITLHSLVAATSQPWR